MALLSDSTGLSNYSAPQSVGWRDMLGPFTAARVPPSNAPVLAQIVSGIDTMQFAVGDYLPMAFHIQHDYLPNSNIFFHIHWSPADNQSGNVVWRIQYSVSRGHNQQVFPAAATIDLTDTVSNNALQHRIIEDQTGFSTNLEPDSLLLCRITLLSKTYAGNVYGHFCDVHYQTIATATKNKTPNFYT